MKTITVLDQVIIGQKAGLYVSVELRHGRIFSGLVQTVMARGDAVEISWHGFGTDLIASREVAAISFRKIAE